VSRNKKIATVVGGYGVRECLELLGFGSEVVVFVYAGNVVDDFFAV
jgi:hypothetical protein